MAHKDIDFAASDGTILRGWLFTPSNISTALPCLIMSHGFAGVKEMDLDRFAQRFTSTLPLACLIYDHRCFGASDGLPRQEIEPFRQFSDLSDAVTYAQTLPEIDSARIGIWGTSYSGGSVLWVGATDRRVKTIISQVPLASGWENARSLSHPSSVEGMQKAFQEDRLARMAGKPPTMIRIIAEDPTMPCALPTLDCYEYFQESVKAGKADTWKNEVTLRSMELIAGNEASAHIHRISPTPLLMVVADKDAVAPTELALEAFSRAREPKQLHILRGGHFDAYSGDTFELNLTVQLEFLKKTLCANS